MSEGHDEPLSDAKRLPPVYALRAFESAARTGSFTRAAEELSLTQSAVSKHVRTLERVFGRKLFTREGPRMVLTPPARILAAGLRRGFRQIEDACAAFESPRDLLRLKAPSTLTMRWLLDALTAFRQHEPGFTVRIASVWMDIDSVDFHSEPYDCAILLGAGRFGDDTRSLKLFDEWLIPVCAPALVGRARDDLGACELIHPSPDRRDWRRWLRGSAHRARVDLTHGQVFDTLEQGNAAAIAGHGVSIGDLGLCAGAIEGGQLAVPFATAVASGDAYHLVWPDDAVKDAQIRRLADFLVPRVPGVTRDGIAFVAAN